MVYTFSDIAPRFLLFCRFMLYEAACTFIDSFCLTRPKYFHTICTNMRRKPCVRNSHKKSQNSLAPKHKVAGVKMFIQWNIQCVSFRHYTRTPSRLAYDECAFCPFSVCVRLMNAFSASWLAHVWKMGYWTCVKWTFNFLEIRNYNCFVDANSHLIPLFARSKW